MGLIQKIAKKFEDALILNEHEMNYSFHIDYEQGVAIKPLNKETETAIRLLPRNFYDNILNNLNRIANDLEPGEGYNLKRYQIFAE